LHCSEEFVAEALLDNVSAVFWCVVAEKPSAEANFEGYLIEKYCFRVLENENIAAGVSACWMRQGIRAVEGGIGQ
jgi:hypothetical protein